MRHCKNLLALFTILTLLLAATLPVHAATHSYDALGRLVETSYDSGSTVSYMYDSMGNMMSIVGTYVDTGVAVSGIILSYNPKNPTTLRLKQGDIVAYTTTVSAIDAIGQREQDFKFVGVIPGAYTLEITKPAHSKFTVQNIVVGETDLDLRQDNREAVKCMPLLCGDLNRDGFINVNDLNTVLTSKNYNKDISQADEPLCDLNGDGFINVNDLNIILNVANYNKGEIIIN